jgi:hypothetical protein
VEVIMTKMLVVAAAAGTALATVAFAQSTVGVAVDRAERVRVGTLGCDISAGIGMIIGSQRQVTCLFTPAEPGPREVYRGTINKFGLDLGATVGGQMVWSVYAPTTQRHAALAGTYAGAAAEATVGIGLGANVLFGGSEQTVALQPVAVQGQSGLNLAVGVAGLELRPAR